MEKMYNDAPCLYFSSTDEGFLVDVNEALCQFLGYNKEELTGQKLETIFTLPTRIFQQTHFFPLLKMQGHAEEIYITLQTKEKEHVPVLINAIRNVVYDKGISIYAGIVVHNRKKFEDELVAAKKAAEKALLENTALQQAKEKLQQHAELLDEQVSLVKKQHEELRQFNHVVTHELQEPLRKLFMFTNMLLDKDDSSSGAKTAKKIRSVSEQMRTIISGLQQYVWLIDTPVTSTEINLNEIINNALSQIIKEHPDVRIHVEQENLPLFMADKEQMKFLFYEILHNAVRFRRTENEARITITASELQLNKFRNVSGKYLFTSYLKVQVTDNGIGFDANYKEQAFALFKRLHSKSGRGIGLSLCKKIVENHQGNITLDSTVGEGTTLTIILPMQQPGDNSHELNYDNQKKMTSPNDR